MSYCQLLWPGTESGGVAPRTAQAAMRHSSIDLTMNVYTDPALLDVHGALDALPSLPLDGGNDDTTQESLKATGTDDHPPRTLAPRLAPNPGNRGQMGSTADKTQSECRPKKGARPDVVSVAAVNEKEPLSLADNDSHEVGLTGHG